jgi:hypothetical protein
VITGFRAALGAGVRLGAGWGGGLGYAPWLWLPARIERILLPDRMKNWLNQQQTKKIINLNTEPGKLKCRKSISGREKNTCKAPAIHILHVKRVRTHRRIPPA